MIQKVVVAALVVAVICAGGALNYRAIRWAAQDDPPPIPDPVGSVIRQNLALIEAVQSLYECADIQRRLNESLHERIGLLEFVVMGAAE